MGFKDKAKQKEFQRQWIAAKREKVLANKSCQYCPSKESLTFVNIKNNGKKFSLSYSNSNLNDKINNALILCNDCYMVYDRERKQKKATKHGHAGKTKSSTYMSWSAMIDRCYNTSKDNYRWYGAKGVEVCERWHNFENFLKDMGERPTSKTLDRIDPYGNYEPSNCRWATASEQGKNKRRVDKIVL